MYLHLVILSAPCKFARRPQPAWVGSAARGCRESGEGPPSHKSHFIYSPRHPGPVRHPLPPCKTHRFARNRSNQRGCRDGAEDRLGAACPGILPSQAKVVGSTTGFGIWILWALQCTVFSGQEPWPHLCALAPLPGGISLFWGALHVLPETDGTTRCLGHTNSSGCNWASFI